MRAQQKLVHIFVIISLIIATSLLGISNASAGVPRAYAGIVVDAKTGKTLYSHEADSLRYPASVTKVMTLYVLFQELEAGNMTLNTKLKVSKHAAAAVPTKLGLKAGSTIRVEDAIKSLVTLSANDMARVIAENISGTESAFAARMTKTAKALGMNNTTYRNASGLPDSGQVTTVRDQSRLAIAAYQHFPKYYEYFQTKSFKYGGRTYGNHNRLLGQNGVDGLKTGYIRAAGYNLMTAARKNDRHIVVIAFGFDSGASRNSKVASLVSKYLPEGRKGSYYAQAVIAKPGASGNPFRTAEPVIPMPRLASRMVPLPGEITTASAQIMPASLNTEVVAPQARPVELMPANAVEATQQMAHVNAPEPASRPAAVDIIGAWINENLSLTPETNLDGSPIPPSGIGGGAVAQPGQTIDLLTSGSVDGVEVAEGWQVQIGAAPSEESARQLLVSALDREGSLNDYRAFIETTQKDGQTFYRARFAGFGDSDQARKMCAQLSAKKMSCLAVMG